MSEKPARAQHGQKTPKAQAAQKAGSVRNPEGTQDTETAGSVRNPESGGRLGVWKTYKLFIGGRFPRSESGRVYEVTDSRGGHLANVPMSSRKDARDAVVAARKAFGGWSGATAHNRGQVLYRVAELTEGRAEQFAAEIAAADGLPPAAARAQVDAAIDRWVWYAGWSDKVAQIAGGANPVSGPYFNLSSPEPTGVVAVLAPGDCSFLGLVSVLAPVIVTGNAAVVVASERAPLPALSLAEVLATSDVPGGVVNVLSGRTREIASTLAAHRDVNAIDLTGAAHSDDDPELARDLEFAAADNLKRVRRPRAEDWRADPGTERLLAFLETKTVWHPMGV
jgi:acyl-CoA reductase-like NAD-dependent aldehyde dehydrogenase